jgi:hypothetical protein
MANKKEDNANEIVSMLTEKANAIPIRGIFSDDLNEILGLEW